MAALHPFTAAGSVLRTAAARLGVSWHTAVQTRLAGDDPEAGMSTAEYALGTVAACGFAGVLYKIITSPLVMDLIKAVLSRAFHLSF